MPDHDGFSNYPTWHTMLVLDNDQHAYESSRESARDIWAHTEANEHFPRATLAKWALADHLKDGLDPDWILEGLAQRDTNAAALLGWAYRQIEWNEIAAAIMDELNLHEDAA